MALHLKENRYLLENSIREEHYKHGIKAITYISREYPIKLKTIDEPPLVLYTKDGVSTPEINAGGSVKILEATTPSAIDNVTVNQNITKFFENGQLVIIKNGVKFNAQGQVIE